MKPKRRNSARRRGFSMLEMLAVVLITGILASIAVPVYNLHTLRAKKTERSVYMAKFEEAVIDYYYAHERFPNGTLGDSTLFGDYNPAWPPSETRRPFNSVTPDWSYLGFQPASDVYFTYQVVAQQTATGSYFWMYAYSDLDGDGVIGYRVHQWELQEGRWARISESESSGIL